ncbi:hypothetical protein AAFF_G00075380 [Aldrovandia affinis]|uniref:Uncharacterized protein n=1 Tax=Aldrovandia affinis TaxID=143900 RepID=A0AAD7WD68_9TELE|nr:hypothetical protein AAFF_G00075380 [Aldrovandia affinis]
MHHTHDDITDEACQFSEWFGAEADSEMKWAGLFCFRGEKTRLKGRQRILKWLQIFQRRATHADLESEEGHRQTGGLIHTLEQCLNRMQTVGLIHTLEQCLNRMQTVGLIHTLEQCLNRMQTVGLIHTLEQCLNRMQTGGSSTH